MNPIQKIRELDERLSKVEAMVAPTPLSAYKSSAKPRKSKDYSYIPRFTDEAKAIIVLAWELLLDERDVEKQPILITEWAAAIKKLDEDNVVPTLAAYGDSLRAVLAERSGLAVIWNRKAVGQSKIKQAEEE